LVLKAGRRHHLLLLQKVQLAGKFGYNPRQPQQDPAAAILINHHFQSHVGSLEGAIFLSHQHQQQFSHHWKYFLFLLLLLLLLFAIAVTTTGPYFQSHDDGSTAPLSPLG
jgi:hypothetical protein